MQRAAKVRFPPSVTKVAIVPLLPLASPVSAAVEPVRAAIRGSRSILLDETSVSGQSEHLRVGFEGPH